MLTGIGTDVKANPGNADILASSRAKQARSECCVLRMCVCMCVCVWEWSGVGLGGVVCHLRSKWRAGEKNHLSNLEVPETIFCLRLMFFLFVDAHVYIFTDAHRSRYQVYRRPDRSHASHL